MPRWLISADRALLGLDRRLQASLVALAMIGCGIVAVPWVPRPFLDYSQIAWLARVPQPGTFGTDTLSDMYEARVVRNDVRDMYAKRLVEQTALEASVWSKEASGPYPPVTLLSLAALDAVGERIGIGLYGFVLGLAGIFLVSSAVYCLKTRWYLFPLMCVNASYIAERFVYVQDNSYLLVLVVMMAALFCARRHSTAAHVLVAIAITMKLSPLYYLKNVPGMSRGTAVLVLGIVVAGLLLPLLLWENSGYIYAFHTGRRAHYWINAAGTLLAVIPFAVVLAYVEARLGFDDEDRVGWGLVPFALVIAISMNAVRHLFLVLLVPDKRGVRTVAGTAGMATHLMLPSVVPSGAANYIILGLLWWALGYYLTRIGFPTVWKDLRNPAATVRLILSAPASRVHRPATQLSWPTAD
jgi:hypothetical protein